VAKQPTYWLTRFLILRLLGLVYFFAFLSLARQVLPLIGEHGLTGRLHAATPQRLADRPYLNDFVRVMRETSLLTLPGVTLL